MTIDIDNDNREDLAAAYAFLSSFNEDGQDVQFVLMPDLSEVTECGEVTPPRNISINYIEIPGCGKFITIGEQIDLGAGDTSGQVRFGGSSVKMVKLPDDFDLRNSDFTEVQSYVLDVLAGNYQGEGSDKVVQTSVRNGIEFISKYFQHMGDKFIGSVFGVDTLSGADQVGLVADMRSRVGGTDPALAARLVDFVQNPEMVYAQAIVELNYGKDRFKTIEERMVEVMNYIDDEHDKYSLQILIKNQT